MEAAICQQRQHASMLMRLASHPHNDVVLPHREERNGDGERAKDDVADEFWRHVVLMCFNALGVALIVSR